MRIILLDQFEFDDTGSEESLMIAIGKSNQHKTLIEFYNSSLCEVEFPQAMINLPEESIEFCDYQYSSAVRLYLDRFTGWTPSSKAAVFQISTDWNYQDILIEEKGTFIRYFWQTSA